MLLNFPELRQELLEMLQQDQREVRECSKAYRQAPNATSTLDIRKKFVKRAQQRIERALEILKKVRRPTIENIGQDGSQALSVLALHAKVSAMKKVLESFEKSHAQNRQSVYYEAIPSLTDRILVIERKPQRFGTQWMLGTDGRFFLPPVEDFSNLNKRRAVYGLGRSKYPIDLTDGVPAIEPERPYTQATDQLVPTPQQYKDFVYGSLD